TRTARMCVACWRSRWTCRSFARSSGRSGLRRSSPSEERVGKAALAPAQVSHQPRALDGGSAADGAKLAGDGLEPLGRDELHATDEDADQLNGGGIDSQRKHGVRDGAG